VFHYVQTCYISGICLPSPSRTGEFRTAVKQGEHTNSYLTASSTSTGQKVMLTRRQRHVYFDSECICHALNWCTSVKVCCWCTYQRLRELLVTFLNSSVQRRRTTTGRCCSFQWRQRRRSSTVVTGTQPKVVPVKQPYASGGNVRSRGQPHQQPWKDSGSSIKWPHGF